jgi:hypothetical protein
VESTEKGTAKGYATHTYVADPCAVHQVQGLEERTASTYLDKPFISNLLAVFHNKLYQFPANPNEIASPFPSEIILQSYESFRKSLRSLPAGMGGLNMNKNCGFYKL